MRSEAILVRFANAEDFDKIPALREDALLADTRGAVYRAQLVIAEEAADFRGYLLFGLYKDTIPFMHKLYVAPEHRSQGYAGEIIGKWETLMREDGYQRVMLTTSSLNTAQNFYRLMGYRDIGSLTLPGEPLEMIFLKDFSKDA